MLEIAGQIVSVLEKRISPGILRVQDGKIVNIDIGETGVVDTPLPFIIPGFVDAHVHIESSMLVPSEFARLAVVHGTVGTVSDPHEIANVCGTEGVEFMINDGKKVPFKFNFGAPSCVPATSFETAGAALTAEDVKRLLARDDIRYLSEMMSFPGVLQKDADVMAKIMAAKEVGKPVDGHAPGLRGSDAREYIRAGITTDHECYTLEEALDKLQSGMKIIIREGSAARNFEALMPLLHDHAELVMFCSDDKHPDSLVKGHIDELCRRAIAGGVDVFNVLRAACVNPVQHYKLDIGLLRAGDPADFVLVEDLQNFTILQTYVNGQLVAEGGRSLILPPEKTESKPVNRFDCSEKLVGDFAIPSGSLKQVPVIEALDGQLITNRLSAAGRVVGGHLVSDIDNDILKIVVVNRYVPAPVAKAFIRNFGIKAGAIASSVAHDSHNIVAVGTDDESICRAVNLIIREKGGISCVRGMTTVQTPWLANEVVLPLSVGGLMSVDDGYKIAARYTELDEMAKALGSSLQSPFMTLSFMALLVIPHLKLSDKGLFDGDAFAFVNPGQIEEQ